MKAPKKAPKVDVHEKTESYSWEAIGCPTCGKVAVVPLTPSERAKPTNQTDGTTHVCHPSLGGCNGGFAV